MRPSGLISAEPPLVLDLATVVALAALATISLARRLESAGRRCRA